MRTVKAHREARLEIANAAAYLEQQRPGYGIRFQKEIRQLITDAAESPERWPLHRNGFRKCVDQRFGYVIWFRENSDEIFIPAVHHGSRKPGFWKDRILDDEQR